MARPADDRPASADRIPQIQRALQHASAVDGWLFYDFRGSDPLAYRVLQLSEMDHVTRRWYYWIPTSGAPIKLVHRIEPRKLDALPGETRYYVSWQEQKSLLGEILGSARHIAMQYSPMNSVPYVSRVDAGTVELIRSFGIEVVSSADLVQQFEAVWDEKQLESHRESAEHLRRIVDEAFAHVSASVRAGTALSEYDLQQFILSRIHDCGMTTSSPPIAAINRHSADPHYTPAPEGSSVLGPGDLVLMDMWAKRAEPGSVYADITWTGHVSDTVPARHRKVFEIVRAARDAAVSYVRRRVEAGDYPYGWEVDEACREVIRSAGYGERFVHRTGHSIGEEVHGNGANVDNLETREARRLMPRTCFSIEPGIYLPDDFGIRSELDVYLDDRGVHIFGQPIQTEVVPILAAP